MTGRGRPPIGPATTIRLPDGLRQELDAIAEDNGWTFAELVREVLENYCREDGR